MAAIVKTAECYPEEHVDSLGFITVRSKPEANHEACSGGHTVPGVYGGWICPCPCHRDLK